MTKEWAKAIVATIVLAVLVVTGTGIAAWNAGVKVPSTDDPETQRDPANVEELADALFTTYVVPFEVLSVLLLGALLGALYVGAKNRKEAGP